MRDPKINRVRYELDFRLMPSLIQRQGEFLINRFLNEGESSICSIFNNVYSGKLNGAPYVSNFKPFQPNQFHMTHQSAKNGWEVLYVTLPDDPFGGDVYCTAYAFAFRKDIQEHDIQEHNLHEHRRNIFSFWKKNRNIKDSSTSNSSILDIRFFTVEKSICDTRCIGSMSTDGNHVNYGDSTGSVKGDIKRILKIVS